jgi:dCMP deaminase
LPTDANYMDLAYLIARNSVAKDGHMGCVFVRPSKDEVVLTVINSAMFGPFRSDCHAEANGIATCAARGVSTRGLAVYVTRAPCTACFKLLASAGVARIVSPQELASDDCRQAASTLGITVVALADSPERRARRMGLARDNEDKDRIRALRAERKRLKKAHAYGKKVKKRKLAENSDQAAS